MHQHPFPLAVGPRRRSRPHKLCADLLTTLAAPLIALTLATACGAAHASEETSQGEAGTYVSVTVDNDFFAGYDQHYTNGIQVAFSADRMALPKALRLLPPLSWSADPHITFAFGQRIYTPIDTDRVQPDPRDRPYGGWAYALADVRVRTGNVVDSVQLSLGVIGPLSLARQTQNTYHKLIGADESKGWDSQIGNAPALLLGYERMWPALQRARYGGFTVDVTPRVGATVGNVYTYANAGAVVRFGQNLPDDFPVTNISLGPPRDGFRPTGSGAGWYVWAGTEARLVGWNAFLDGNLFSNGPSVNREPFGYDVQIGAAVLWKKARVGFTFVSRGKEFETQAGRDKFGQLTVSFPV
jgi:lipid A 3-O-deacylase